MTNIKVSARLKNRFLAELVATCSVNSACKKVGITRPTAYAWREADEKFAQAWVLAKQYGGEALEDEAVRRAMEGYEVPVYYKGKKVDVIRKYSDPLLIQLLQANIPEKYHMSKFELHNFEGVARSFYPPIQARSKALGTKLNQIAELEEADEADEKIDHSDLA